MVARPVAGGGAAAFGSIAGILVACVLAACTSEAKRVPLDVPDARAPSATARIADDVSRLLSADPDASAAAARELSSLDDEGRAALAAHAKRIPGERDPRWLTVLEENGLWAEAGPAERVDLFAWQAARSDPRLVWRAQSGLLELARSHPDVLEAKLSDASCPARDALAVALADARSTRSVPALVGLYRTAVTPAELRAAAFAIGRLAGEERRPRVDATPAERERDAEKVLAWYRTSGGSDEKR